MESIRLTFRSSADYWGECLSFGYGGNQRPYVSGTSFGNAHSLSLIPDAQSLLWIGKIIRRADGEDEISFRIYGENDALDYAGPGIAERMKSLLLAWLERTKSNQPEDVKKRPVAAN